MKCMLLGGAQGARGWSCGAWVDGGRGDGWTGQGAGVFRATTRVAPARGDAIAYPTPT
jgi:hypothetical protein